MLQIQAMLNFTLPAKNLEIVDKKIDTYYPI